MIYKLVVLSECCLYFILRSSQWRRTTTSVTWSWTTTSRKTSYEPKRWRIWSSLARLDLVWSCATRLPSPVDEWEAPAAQLLKYSRKDTWETPAVSHNIFVSHTGGQEGGGLCVPAVNSASHTCWTFAYLYGRCQRRRGGRRFQTLFPSPLFSHFSSTCFKTWTCQSNTSMSNLMWLYIFLFSLFKTSKWESWCLSRTGGYCGTSCVDFSYTTLFQLCENKKNFVTKIKRNKNNHGLLIHCYNIRKLISLSACNTKGI